MITANIKVYSPTQHNRMIVTGYKMLKQQSIIDYNLCVVSSSNSELHRIGLVEAEIKASSKTYTLAYDLLDGYNFNTKEISSYLDTVDFYFKRSFSKDMNEQLFNEKQRCKIYPLSLNYDVSFFFNPIEYQDGALSTIKTIFKKLYRRNDVKYYEKRSNTQQYDCLFLCKLWDPDAIDEPTLKKERTEINRNRIQLIRALRKEFGTSFIGGVENSSLAQRLCPDLIIDKKITSKKNYMNIMRQSKVCIATSGLHNSIGWKFAEYVAAGKAIVSEQLVYEPYGDLKEGLNYLSFKTVDDALEKIKTLVNDDSKRNDMETANTNYYLNYQRPDKQILNSLKIVGLL